MTKFQIIDIISRIEAMRSQEENTKRSHNYFSKTHPVDAGSRKAMADWCTQIVDSLSFSRETVGIAITYLDRYLSSGMGNSSAVLENRHEFQLASIASFYLAVKLHEPTRLDVDLLVKLCRGFYSEEDILSMEKDILFALDWRVSGPTPLDFARHLLELLPESVDSSFSEYILQNAEKHSEYATTEMFFSSCKPSVVGLVCILSALSDIEILTTHEEIHFCNRMSKALGYDVSSIEVLEVQQQMMSQSFSTESVPVVKTSKSSQSNNGSCTTNIADDGSCSPVCVSHAAHQQ